MIRSGCKHPFIAAALFFSLVLACARPALAEDVQQNEYETLRNIKLFAIGPVGDGGEPSEGERAFRKLLEMPDAANLFKKLLTEGTREGRLYALLALRNLDPKVYEAAAPRYVSDKAEVRTMTGCMGWHCPVSDIARQIDSGEIHADADERWLSYF